MPLTEEQKQFVKKMSPDQRKLLRAQIRDEMSRREDGVDLGKDEDNPTSLDRFMFNYDSVGYDIEEFMNRKDEYNIRHETYSGLLDDMQQDLIRLREEGKLNDFTWNRAKMQLKERQEAQAAQIAQKQQELQQSRMAAREDYLRKQYRGIYGTEWEQGFASGAGVIAKFLASPTLLIPFWKSENGYRILGNMLLGGSIAAWDIGVRDMVNKGEITTEDAAILISFGAAIPLFLGGGANFLNWAKGKIANKTQATAEELAEQARQAGVDIEDPGKLADQLNEIIAKTPEKRPSTVLSPVNPYEGYLQPVTPKELSMPAYKAEGALLKEVQGINLGEKNILPQSKELKGGFDYGKSAQGDTVEIFSEMDKIKDARARGKRGSDIGQATSSKASKATAFEQAEQAAEAAKLRQMDRDFLAEEIAQKALEEGPIIQKGLRNEVGNIDSTLMMHLGAAAIGGIGGAAMNPEDPMAGFLVGAAVGGVLPVGARVMYKGIGKFGDGLEAAAGGVGKANDALLRDRMWGSIFSRPSAKMDAHGETSRLFSGMIQEAEVATRKMANRFVYDFEKMEKTLKRWKDPKGKKTPHLTEDEWMNLSQVMEKTHKPINQRVAFMAKFAKKEFDDVVNMAVSRGLYTAEKGRHLKAKGYWPHIYNEPKLQTEAGQKEWVERLSAHGWNSEEEINEALGHILYGHEKTINEMRDFITKRGSKYNLTQEGARRLLKFRRKVTLKQRSHHLERPRMLNFPYEVLEPFLVKDPKKVLTEYFYDVSKRFSFADRFGNNDEIAEGLITKLRNEFEDTHPEWGVAEHASETYYTAVGDTSKSTALAKQAGWSDMHKRITGGLNAAATWKLTLAPILNTTQVHILGPTYMSKHMPYHVVAKNWYKGVRGLMTKEGRDYAARTAAVFETTLMQILGESSITHTVYGAITGKELQGAFKGLDYFSDPAKFLRLIQFVNTEKMNRIVAANMGKAHFESLLDIRKALDAGKYRSPKKAAAMKRKFTRAMEELGLDPNKKVFDGSEPYDVARHFSEADAEHAGLMFSDKVNFVNDVTKLPLWWRANPYYRLAFKFKSFSFHFGSFMVDNILAPMKEGNFKPLLTFTSVGLPFGMGADEVRRMVAMDDREFTNTERMLRAFGSVGGMGIALDAALGISDPYGGRVIGTVFGPVGGDIYNLIQGARLSGKNAIEHSVFSGEAAGPLSRAVVSNIGGGYPGKQALLEELEALYKNKQKGNNQGYLRSNR